MSVLDDEDLDGLTDAEKLIRLKLKKLEYLEAKAAELKRKPYLHLFPHYTWSREFFEDLDTRIQVVCSANQLSKALDINEDIPTPFGFKKMKDIQIGDYVFGRDGKPTRVIDIPFVGEDTTYEIEFDDGDKIIASKDHDWICMGPEQRFRKFYKGKTGYTIINETYQKWQVKSTQDILDHCYSDGKPKAPRRYVVPFCSPVEYPTQELPIEPYMLGLMIGDGSLGGTREHEQIKLHINGDETEILEYLSEFYQFKHKDRNCVAVSLAKKTGFKDKVKNLKLNVYSQDKFIPEQYLLAGVGQRKELLAGLMDTNGTSDASGQSISYSTCSEKLANDVKQLVRSLGGSAWIARDKAGYKKDGVYHKCLDTFNVHIKTTWNVFKLAKQKRSRWTYPRRYAHQKVIYRITPIENVKTKCITVENVDGSFLVSKNYVVTHNSSSQIRKVIELAVNRSKWAQAWPKRAKSMGSSFVPNLFWYFYPDRKTADAEWRFKWSQFMPPKDDPELGWEVRYDTQKYISEVEFKSGVTLQFKFYSQDAINIQSSSVYYCGIDEECPWDIIPEILMRLSATDGMFSAVFTATIGQDEWRRVVEPKTEEERIWAEARVWQVSMYQCVTYDDGSPSPWSVEEIRRVEAKCATEKEIQRRVFGRFVKDEGLMITEFNSTNRCSVERLSEIKRDWPRFAAVDYGGGGTSHPAAITFVACSPDFKLGFVYKCWRGDGITTSAQDVLDKYLEMRGADYIWQVSYDWAAKDLHTLAERQGLAVKKADKQREAGAGLMNSLFKQHMLWIPNGNPSDHQQFDKLASEINALSSGTVKNKAKDDLYDSTRYALMLIPWQFDYLGEYKEPIVAEAHQEPRRDGFDDVSHETFSDEMEYWQDLLDN